MLTTPIGTMQIATMPNGAIPMASRFGLSPHWPMLVGSVLVLACCGSVAAAGHPLVPHFVGTTASKVPGGCFSLGFAGINSRNAAATG
jgi:hypothetical protein